MVNDNNINNISSKVIQKQQLHQLEKQLELENHTKFEKTLQKAKQVADGDENALDGLRWIEIFSPMGVHPSYILQAWAWQKFRSITPAPDVMA